MSDISDEPHPGDRYCCPGCYRKPGEFHTHECWKCAERPDHGYKNTAAIRSIAAAETVLMRLVPHEKRRTQMCDECGRQTNKSLTEAEVLDVGWIKGPEGGLFCSECQ